MGYRIFQGANGWYVAWEGKDGTHRQPPSFVRETQLTREQAQRKLAEIEHEAMDLPECEHGEG